MGMGDEPRPARFVRNKAAREWAVKVGDEADARHGSTPRCREIGNQRQSFLKILTTLHGSLNHDRGTLHAIEAIGSMAALYVAGSLLSKPLKLVAQTRNHRGRRTVGAMTSETRLT